jgi:hypothetical protein
MLISENLKLSSLQFGNLAANGVLGTGDNIDRYAIYSVLQTSGTEFAPIVATLQTPVNSEGSTILKVINESTGYLSIYGKLVKPTKHEEFIFSNGIWRASEQSLISGNIIAKTPYNAGPETVVVFDNMEIKWHQSGSSFDGIAIRSTTTPISVRYTSSEFYLGSAAADGGKSVYGSNNAWYNLPNLGATATIINAIYPYAQTISTTFLGMGNPAMPNADYRLYKLYNDTTQTEYEIIVDKQGSTGEITTAQTGTCSIVVRKIGITTNQILTANNGITITNGLISQNQKQYALYTRNATLTTATNTNIPWTTNVGFLGSEINAVGANITLTPFNGVPRVYKIRFNGKYTFNAVLSHIVDFRLRNPLATAQTINGVSIPANAYFGEGTSLFSTTNGSQEAGSGILEYVITTNVPITFCVSIEGQANTPTLGSATSNRYPTIEIESIN